MLTVYSIFLHSEKKACARTTWPSWSPRSTGATGYPWNPRYSRKQCCGACRASRTSWATRTARRSRSSRYKTCIESSSISNTRARELENEQRDPFLRLQLFPASRHFPTAEWGSSCQNWFTHCSHCESFWCRMSNIVWSRNDLSLNYARVCFLLIILSPQQCRGQNLNTSPSCSCRGSWQGQNKGIPGRSMSPF